MWGAARSALQISVLPYFSPLQSPSRFSSFSLLLRRDVQQVRSAVRAAPERGRRSWPAAGRDGGRSWQQPRGAALWGHRGEQRCEAQGGAAPCPSWSSAVPLWLPRSPCGHSRPSVLASRGVLTATRTAPSLLELHQVAAVLYRLYVVFVDTAHQGVKISPGYSQWIFFTVLKTPC